MGRKALDPMPESERQMWARHHAEDVNRRFFVVTLEDREEPDGSVVTVGVASQPLEVFLQSLH